MFNFPLVVYLAFIGIILVAIYLIKTKVRRKSIGVVWVSSFVLFLLVFGVFSIITFISYISFDSLIEDYNFSKTYIEMLNEEIVKLNEEILFCDNGDGIISEEESAKLEELYFKKDVKVTELKSQVNKIESIIHNLKSFIAVGIPKQVEVYNSIPSLRDGYEYQVAVSGELVEVIP